MVKTVPLNLKGCVIVDFDYIEQGDCLELMKKIPNESIDMILTDPPYGINLTPQREDGKFKNTVVLNDDNLHWLDNCVCELHRISKNVVCVFCGWQKIDVFKQAFEKMFIIKNILVWDKDWFGMGNNYRPNYELCLLCCKTNVVTKSKNKSNILKYRRISPTKLVHSCEKPVALLEDLISELSDEDEIVLDPFMGSGSTCVAAVNTNRHYIGFELDEKYFQIACDRLDEAEKAVVL